MRGLLQILKERAFTEMKISHQSITWQISHCSNQRNTNLKVVQRHPWIQASLTFGSWGRKYQSCWGASKWCTSSYSPSLPCRTWMVDHKASEPSYNASLSSFVGTEASLVQLLMFFEQNRVTKRHYNDYYFYNFIRRAVKYSQIAYSTGGKPPFVQNFSHYRKSLNNPGLSGSTFQ